MIYLAIINRYKISDDGKNYEANLSNTIHSSKKDGLDYGYIDFDKATKGELLAFRQGWVDRIVNEKDFIETNQNDSQSLITDISPQNMNQSKQNEMGKTLTLTNGHSIIGSDREYPNGFSSRFLISLLAGFGLGVIAATIYIFTNLSNITYYFQ